MGSWLLLDACGLHGVWEKANNRVRNAGLLLKRLKEYPHVNGDKPFLQMKNFGHSW